MNILILEDEEHRMIDFRERLAGNVIYHATTPKEAIAHLRKKQVDVAFLDHDLSGRGKLEAPSRKTGWWVAKWLGENPRYAPVQIYIHSLNQLAAKVMQHELPQAELLPFAWRYTWDRLGNGKGTETLKAKGKA